MHLDMAGISHTLDKHGQQHLLQFWDTLREEERQSLLHQLEHVDFQHVDKMYQQTKDSAGIIAQSIDKFMEPVPSELYGGVKRNTAEELKDFLSKGLHAVSNGEVAVILLAGGQGTRLGVDYPKGMYSVGLPSNKTLYQIQAERILRLQDLAKESYGKSGKIRWYIMTSEHTKHATETFFSQHDYFGLDKKSVVIFEQEMLPCFDFDGKIILESPSKIASAPGGNGGLYRALLKEKVLDDMSQNGIKYVHACGVDNILVRMADPHFIGYCIAKNLECGNKVVAKTDPNEAVGVVCLVRKNGTKGIWQVVEYSEILPETAQRRLSDGSLMFNAGNIANHFFTTDFLNDICRQHDDDLPYHIAKKKIPYVDCHGATIKPAKPNGIKMEKFIFDVFQFANRFAVWEPIRSDEFAPLKNADGASDDTPTTARNAVFDLHARFISRAGGEFIRNEGEQVVCEISPLVSYGGEGLEERVRGKTFESPCIID
ncbi:UDP-N-acetylhexosamine pyrophosphorylase-like [Paramacrobiotus metropolitanus]|uniref:UDP-N-acetylhexosamine pyrophosphorylase-like n=1 Tax=Paramacrobiotus metropolitanus TaxID=2943436 RepID=UPI0024457288|nr:UDP-N-acetylhexosamine pyrophosphorylase-like [Paramacrobiotus metropolitanus]